MVWSIDCYAPLSKSKRRKVYQLCHRNLSCFLHIWLLLCSLLDDLDAPPDGPNPSYYEKRRRHLQQPHHHPRLTPNRGKANARCEQCARPRQHTVGNQDHVGPVVLQPWDLIYDGPQLLVLFAHFGQRIHAKIVTLHHKSLCRLLIILLLNGPCGYSRTALGHASRIARSTAHSFPLFSLICLA